jgi:hypothetical protein
MVKLSLSRAWDESSAVLARDGRLFLPVALALFVLPGVVLDVTMPPTSPGQLPPGGPWLAIAAVALIMSLVGQLAVIRLSIEPHVAVGDAIMHGLKRFVPYLVAVLAWLIPILVAGGALYGFLEVNQEHPSVVAALLLIALTLVGFYLAVRLILSSAVASAEHVGPFGILKRSWDLTHGNWWRLFVFLALFWIGAVCLLWAIQSVFGLLVQMMFADSGPLTVGTLLIAVVSQLVSAFLFTIFFVLLARIYAQLSGTAAASVPNTGI